ncbi:hypothetical protein HBI92_081550 [Parastagonospora nodorum]|nr:hypothetical protein HBH78_158800 [Parastagonospora nodorum]KAH5783311.1 hypothetical protein HBI97_090310 [Parastagonospora nodorum]KAH5866592.1 hypothetical protein HBI90_115500 [Parastagonospora nodorum]KAH5891792.1 hypothetical protein HBI92_081550 [Parastagonospora nodorum]
MQIPLISFSTYTIRIYIIECCHPTIRHVGNEVSAFYAWFSRKSVLGALSLQQAPMTHLSILPAKRDDRTVVKLRGLQDWTCGQG